MIEKIYSFFNYIFIRVWHSWLLYPFWEQKITCSNHVTLKKDPARAGQIEFMLNNFGFLVILLSLSFSLSLFFFSRYPHSINFTIFIYLSGIIIIMFGFTYAAVPLYQLYRRVYGLNNT